MENKLMIYETMIRVMKRVSFVPKGKRNLDQGFQYRSIDDVMSELHTIMAEEGLFCIPTVLDIKEDKKLVKSGAEWNHVKQLIAYDFYAIDGSTIRSVVRGEALDSGDKASNKGLAIALKYVLTQAFMIPTEDDKDPDAHTISDDKVYHPTSPQNEPESKEGKTTQESAKTITGQGLDTKTKHTTALSKTYFAVAKNAGYDSEKAKEIAKKAYGVESFTQLTNPQLTKLVERLSTRTDKKKKEEEKSLVDELEAAIPGGGY